MLLDLKSSSGDTNVFQSRCTARVFGSIASNRSTTGVIGSTLSLISSSAARAWANVFAAIAAIGSPA